MFKQIELARPGARTELIALIASLMALNALAIDIMLPALPNISRAYSLSEENQQQLVITLYLLGFGLFQIFFGPLADRFGRRPPLIIGVGVYIAAAILSVFASGFEMLLALRFLQGAGAASTRVITQSIVRDKFAGRTMAEIMSLAHMVFMVVPILSPGLGQIFLFFGEWQLLFIVITILGAAVLLWLTIRLPETLDDTNRRPLTLGSIFGAFGTVLSNRIAMWYTFAGTFIFGGFMSYLNLSQQIYTEIYGLGAWFPLAFATTAFSIAAGSLLNARAVHRLGMRRIAHSAILVYVGSAITMLIWSWIDTPPLPVFFILMCLCLFMMGWIIANMVSLSMEPLGRVAGSASAVFGTIQTVFAAILGIVISQTYTGTIMPLPVGLTICGACALISVLIAENGRLLGVDET